MNIPLPHSPPWSRRTPGPITSDLEVKAGRVQRVSREAGGYGSRRSPGRDGWGRRLRISLAVLWLAFALSPSAFAVQPDEIMPDPAKEARARDLSRELRCMVCQNQSIDDSEAPLARDLRLLVRERLKAGDSDTQVVDFMVARYGEFVLLKPRVNWHTAILWGTPLAILIAGLFAVGFSVLRRSAGTPLPVAKLSEGERLKLGAIEQSQQEQGF